MEFSFSLSGAGGNWPRERERQDPRVVVQDQALYCGCACAVMVSAAAGIANIPTQEQLYQMAGAIPFSVDILAEVLNEVFEGVEGEWRGQFVGLREGETYEEVVEILSRNRWIAQLHEPMARLSHFVVVDAQQDNELIILDPAVPGTSYGMHFDDFLQSWTWGSVYLVN